MSVIQRQVDYRRTNRANNAAQTRIVRPLAYDPPAKSFSARMSVDQNGNEVLRVREGYRQRETDEPVLCTNGGDDFVFTHVDGNFVYTVFTYATDPNTKGTFDETLQCTSSPPPSNTARHTRIIAAMITVDGVKTFVQRHDGDIIVRDMIVCGDCS